MRLKLNVSEIMGFVRTCVAFIVIYLQFSIKVAAAVKDVKPCEKLQKRPALTICQSGVLSNVTTGYINLASQSNEEFQCTITPVHTESSTATLELSFVQSSETHNMSICMDKKQMVCLKDKSTQAFNIESTRTLYYRTEALHTREVACLKIHVKNGTVNVTCYDRQDNNSTPKQINLTMDEGIQSTGTVHETILSTAEPFEGTTKQTQLRIEKGEKENNSDGASSVPIIAAGVSVPGCLIIVAAVLLVKYRKSRKATSTGDIETENPLYNADENTVTVGRYLATFATDETHYLYASTKQNEKMKIDTATESGNRIDEMVLTRGDLAENTDYNEIMPLTEMNDSNSAAPQDSPNSNDYSIIDDENGPDEIDKIGKATGCSDTYYSQIDIPNERNRTVDDESTSAIVSDPALMNAYTVHKAQQVESELDVEYHHLNETTIATPFNEYDRIRRQVSNKDFTRDSTYNHV